MDLVICGKQSIDGDTGQVGPGLAHRLGMSQVTYICGLEGIDLEAGVIRAWRQLENGRELLEAKLPAALTITETCNRIRYASLPDLIAAAEQTGGGLDRRRHRSGPRPSWDSRARRPG